MVRSNSTKLLSDEYPHRYLLLVNDESLLSFYVRVPDELSFELFLEGLPQHSKKCFLDYKLTDKQIKYLLGSYREVRITAVNNSRKQQPQITVV